MDKLDISTQALIVSYLGSDEETLRQAARLGSVCKAWSRVFHRSDVLLWQALAGLFVTPSFVLPVSLRAGGRGASDLRRVILRARRKYIALIHETHAESLFPKVFSRLMACRRDAPVKLTKIIHRCFPLDDGKTLGMKSFFVNYRSPTLFEGNTLLNLCARHGLLKCVKLLTESHGADVNVAEVGGFTPLINAAYRGDGPMCGYLVRQGADRWLRGAERAGRRHTAEYWAFAKGHSQVQYYLAGLRRKEDKARLTEANAELRRASGYCVYSKIQKVHKLQSPGGRKPVSEKSEVRAVVVDMCRAVSRCNNSRQQPQGGFENWGLTPGNPQVLQWYTRPLHPLSVVRVEVASTLIWLSDRVCGLSLPQAEYESESEPELTREREPSSSSGSGSSSSHDPLLQALNPKDYYLPLDFEIGKDPLPPGWEYVTQAAAADSAFAADVDPDFGSSSSSVSSGPGATTTSAHAPANPTSAATASAAAMPLTPPPMAPAPTPMTQRNGEPPRRTGRAQKRNRI